MTSRRDNRKQRRSAEDADGYFVIYDRYLTWCEESSSQERTRKWGLSLLVAATLIVAAALIPFPEVVAGYAEAVMVIPASMIIFAIGAGAARIAQVKGERESLRERYSPNRRRKIAGVIAVLAAISSLTLAPRIPYSLGGAVFVTVLIALLHFLRLTPEEKQLEELGLLDPRDIDDGIDVESIEEDPDILDDSFDWNDHVQGAPRPE